MNFTMRIPRSTVPGLGIMALAVVFGLGSNAAAQEPQLRDLYTNARISSAGAVWNPNGTVTIAYELKNFSNRRLVLPQTKIGNTLAFWAGYRQLWIERVGGGPVPPLDRIANPKIAKRGPWQYASGGYAIPTNGVLEAGEVLRFSDTINTVGFPPGRYNVWIEYETLDKKVIHTRVVTFTVQ